MKKYKVVKVREPDAERIMNEMAKEGWEVVTVTYYSFWWVSLLITFQRSY